MVSLASQDCHGATSDILAANMLKWRYLVPAILDGQFNELCGIFGLKPVSDAYLMVRERWPETQHPATKEEMLPGLSVRRCFSNRMLGTSRNETHYRNLGFALRQKAHIGEERTEGQEVNAQNALRLPTKPWRTE